MTPRHGGKIELKLTDATEESAAYAVHLETSAATFHTDAQVGAQVIPAQVQFAAWSSDTALEPPEWLIRETRAALKAALRTSQAEGRWPRRIARWRPEPAD